MAASDIDISKVIHRLNVNNSKKYGEFFPHQVEAVKAAALGDTLVCVHTGGGKSRIIEALPYLSDEHTIIIIISPLNSIQYEMAERYDYQIVMLKTLIDLSIFFSFLQFCSIYAKLGLGHRGNVYWMVLFNVWYI